MDFTSGNGKIASNYFLANTAKSTKYEDTLPDFDNDEGKITSIDHHAHEKAALKERLTSSLFPKIFTLLDKGYNVVLYGIGSKRRFIEQFRQQLLEDHISIVLYGYKDVIQRQILSAFQEALDCDKGEEDTIIKKIAELEKPIFLLIHSFDRLHIRNPKIKSLINKILTSSQTKVKLLTTVDHVNSSLIWTCREGDLLNLYWINCPTFDDYSIEQSFAHLSTSRSSGSAKQRSAASTIMAVTNVYENLPMNSQNIFLLILNFYKDHYSGVHELDKPIKPTGLKRARDDEDESDSNSDEDVDEPRKKGDKHGKSSKGFEGYPFNSLYQDCMDAFYVNSEATLRTQLVEFVDHKLVRSRQGTDGSEFIELLIAPKLIPKLLQELSH